MPSTTANTVNYVELDRLLHDFYTLGQRITDYITLHQISNTVLSGVCTEIKGNRGGKVNTAHTGILTILAGL